MQTFFGQLLIILFLSANLFAQPQMSLWWSESINGQAIIDVNHEAQEAATGIAVKYACDAEIYIQYGDYTEGNYQIAYHILNEGDQDLVISNMSLSTTDAEYSLDTYGLTGDIIIKPNHEFEFIVNYDAPSEYSSSNASLSFNTNEAGKSNCGLSWEVGGLPPIRKCTDSEGLSVGFLIDENTIEAEIEAAFFDFINSLPCKSGARFVATNLTVPPSLSATHTTDCRPDVNGPFMYNCCGGGIFVGEGTPESAGTIVDECEQFCTFDNIVGRTTGIIKVGNGHVDYCFECRDCAYFTVMPKDCISIVDPCACDNPLNVVVDGETLYQDVIRIEGLGDIDALEISANDGNLLDENGDALAVGTEFTVEDLGIYELEIFTKVPATIDIRVEGGEVIASDYVAGLDINGIPCVDVCVEPVPTIGQWGIIILSLLLVSLGVGAVAHRYQINSIG